MTGSKYIFNSTHHEILINCQKRVYLDGDPKLYVLLGVNWCYKNIVKFPLDKFTANLQTFKVH